MREVDLAIIGAGAAGMAAALYAKRAGLNLALLDASEPGGMTAVAIDVENYPGVGKVKGKELAGRFEKQIAGLGVKTEDGQRVEAISRRADARFEIASETGKITAKAVILATGSEHKKLNVKGEHELFGRGVSYCATCDGPLFRGMKVGVIGGGNSGATTALYMAEMCPEVYLIEYAKELACEYAYKKLIEKNRKIKVLVNSETSEITGDRRVKGIVVKDRAAGKASTIEVGGVFIHVGLVPQSALAKQIGAELDAKGQVKVDAEQKTSVKGLFAAGDVTPRLKQVVTACGDGAVAAISAYNYIRGLK